VTPASKRSSDDADPRAVALRLLAGREHSRLELTRKLQARGFERMRCEDTVAGLVAEGLLSEERFAEVFVHARQANGYGPERIRLELEARGVDRRLAEAFIAEDDPTWIELAAAARRKRFGPSLPREYREKARQTQFLRYRGFTPMHIRAVLDEDG
jgi:regulatory protein